MVHIDCPIAIWCRFLPQAEMTLNTIRSQLGAKVILFHTPDNRTSLAPHGAYGYTIGPALDHYRCVSVYLPKKRATVTANTFH